MFRVLLIIALLFSVACKNQDQGYDYSTDSHQLISTDQIDDYFIDGLDKRDVQKALSGDFIAAQKIANQLHSLPQQHLSKRLYWRMIAAENGSVQAMYDLAISSDCRPRSRFWGKKFLERIDPHTTSKAFINMREGVISVLQEKCDK